MGDGSHFRKDSRRGMGLPIRFWPEGGAETEGVLLDLALGGAFVATPRPPEPGEWVYLELGTPESWEPHRVAGRVRWSRDGSDGECPGFGLGFTDLHPSAAKAIDDLIATNRFSEPSS